MSGPTISDALHAATKLGAFLEQFSRARTVLEAAALVEQQTAGAIAARDRAVADKADAETELQRLRDAIGKGRAQVEEIEKEAQQIRASAEAAAKKILEDATAKGEKIRAGACAELDSVRNEAQGVINRTEAARRELAALTKELEHTRAHLIDVKEQARKAFGG